MNDSTTDKTLKCPVCSSAVDVSSEEMHCKICNADLTSIRRLKELGDRYCNEALSLAGKGEYDRAFEKLMSALQYHDDPAAVRILAGKVLHRKGRYEEALDQWQQAADQGNSEAEDLTRAARRNVRSRRLTRIAAHAAAYCVLLTALVLSIRYAAGFRDKSRHYAGRVTALQDRMGKIRTSTAPRIEELAALAGSLEKDQGLMVTQKPGEITIVFREGLFPNASDRLDDRSAARLTSVADTIRRYGKPCRVEVEGFTNSIPLRAGSRWGDGWSLGLARARAAADCMGCKSSDSTIKWLVSSSGERRYPFPNDMQEDRARNRTVVIHITPS